MENKVSKKPFDPKLDISNKIFELALSPKFNMTVYPGNGTVDGIRGNHILIAPPLNIKTKDVDYIVKVLSGVIREVFKKLYN